MPPPLPQVIRTAAVETVALDEQIRERATRLQRGELASEMPSPDRAVQIEHGLALDERVVTERMKLPPGNRRV